MPNSLSRRMRALLLSRRRTRAEHPTARALESPDLLPSILRHLGMQELREVSACVCTCWRAAAAEVVNEWTLLVPLSSLGGRRGAEADQFDGPAFVLSLPAGSILVADSHNHRLIKLSPDLCRQQVLSSPGSEPGQVYEPMGLDADRQWTTIAVADKGNDRVQLLGLEDGAPLAVSPPGVLSLPSGLAVAPAGAGVVVADQGNHRCVVLCSTTLVWLRSIEHEALPFPTDVALYRDTLVVALGGLHRLVFFEFATGRWLRELGCRGKAPQDFIRPFGVTVIDGHASGVGEPLLCVAEYHRVQVLTLDGQTRQILCIHGAGLNGISCSPDASDVWVGSSTKHTLHRLRTVKQS